MEWIQKWWSYVVRLTGLRFHPVVKRPLSCTNSNSFEAPQFCPRDRINDAASFKLRCHTLAEGVIAHPTLEWHVMSFRPGFIRASKVSSWCLGIDAAL